MEGTTPMQFRDDLPQDRHDAAAAFLAARVAVDEQEWSVPRFRADRQLSAFEARMLAETRAKLRILDWYTKAEPIPSGAWDDDAWNALGDVILALAATYAEHPDYRPEWKA